MTSGITKPTPKAIVCDFFLPLDDDGGRFIWLLVEVEDEIMVVREELGFEIDPAEEREGEEFEVDGKAGMTTWLSLTGSVMNVSLPVQQYGAFEVTAWQHQEWLPQEDVAWLLIKLAFAIQPDEWLADCYIWLGGEGGEGQIGEGRKPEKKKRTNNPSLSLMDIYICLFSILRTDAKRRTFCRIPWIIRTAGAISWANAGDIPRTRILTQHAHLIRQTGEASTTAEGDTTTGDGRRIARNVMDLNISIWGIAFCVYFLAQGRRQRRRQEQKQGGGQEESARWFWVDETHFSYSPSSSLPAQNARWRNLSMFVCGPVEGREGESQRRKLYVR